jgi:predicted nuclease with TOPRIM domain
MIAVDEDRLERVRDNIDVAENEYAKYTDMITDKKNKLEMLTSKENELVERTKIAENVYDMFQHGGDDDVREKLIDVMYENQRLQEENKSLNELLKKAYDFMKQFVIDGGNLLEKFMESVGKVMERLSLKTK